MNMKKNLALCLLALGLAANRAAAENTDGKVTYTVTTVNYNGGYDPKHVSVVWVVNGSGSFVKTLCRHAGTRINYLYKWIADRGSYTAVDGVTSATLATQPQTHTVVWDCRGTNGQVTADGTYNFRAEYTSSNAQGPYMANVCTFVKGAVAVTTNFPAYSNASGQFTGLSLTYTPYNEIAVKSLAPASGVVNSNVAVTVAVSNETLNTLSFSVAVSNLTSGTLLGSVPVPALAGRAATNLTVHWNTAGFSQGNYQLRATASTLPTETNTANNVFTGTISLTSASAADLAVNVFSPSVGVIGGAVPLSVTVTNKTGAAVGPFTVAVSNLTGSAVVPGSNTWQVAASSDDAEENLSSHAVSLTSTDLELVVDTASQAVGLRFASLAIPRGAEIQSAFIQFTDKTGENLNTDPIGLSIAAEASDSALTFGSAASNITRRAVTAAAVPWSPGTWADAAAGADQRTPDLAALVQEVVGRSGWSSGNALAFVITGTGARRAWSFNGSAAGAPRLTVQWVTRSHLVGERQIASLGAFGSTNVVFAWSTAGATAGVYRLTAHAGPVATESVTGDNVRTNDVALREALHDVAVAAVRIAALVPPDAVTNVTVSVTNLGDVAESFTASLREVTGAPQLIGSQTVTSLPAYGAADVVFPWNTATNATFRSGYHTLEASLSPVAGETALADNTQALEVVVANGLATRTLVSKSAVWKYLDKGLDPGGAPWKGADYYDGFWASGPSPLGYTLTNIATAVSYGGVATNRYITTYFRQAFTLDATPLSVTGRLMRADGAVLYLNGVEIARHNMPAGNVAFATRALSAVTGTNAVRYYDFPLAVSNLVRGRNLLAAELHLSVPNREACGFSLELEGVVPNISPAPLFTPSGLASEGSAQSGDAAGVSVTVRNAGNVTATCLVLIRDAATGAVLGSATVGPLAPGESADVRVTLATFGAATGDRTLQAVTVCNGVTNMAGAVSVPFRLETPDFTARTVAAAGSIGGRCSAVAAVGGTVYLGCGSTLEAWDASVPAAPVRRAALRLPGLIEDLVATNGWVYAASGASGVQIVQAVSSTQLVLRATYDTTGHARRLAFASDRLYIADTLGGVRVLNVALPAAPTLAGAYATTGPALSVAAVPPRLLVLDGQRGLLNLHAADPAALSVTGAYAQVTAGRALLPAAGAAYVADASARLLKLNTTSPTNLTGVTNALLPEAAQSLAASDTALYAASGGHGLLTLDASTLAVVRTEATGDEASALARSGNRLYLAAGFSGCLIYDVSAPLAPTLVGWIPVGARGSDAAALGSTLYVAAGEGGLQIHRLQELGLPERLGAVAGVTNARCVAVAYPRLYVAEGPGALKIFSLADPTAPAWLGTYVSDRLSHIRRLAVAGDRVALTDGRVIELISAADAAAPQRLSGVESAGFVFDLTAVPGEVYAACGGAGVQALRMDSLAPDATVATPGPATALALVSNLLTVACGPGGWLTLNVDNAAAPVPVLSTPGSVTFEAAAAGSRVALTDGARAADVMNLTAPLAPVLEASFTNLTAALRLRGVAGLIVAAEDEAGLTILNVTPGDINANGVPDAWEQQIVAASLAENGSVRSVLDIDLQTVGPNGFTYYQSYLAGLTPTDPSSVLAISAVTPLAQQAGQITVTWKSVAGKRYTLYKSSDLAAGFAPVPGATGLVAAGATSSYTDTMTAPRAFYMIVVTP